MFFPISGAHISPIYLAVVGFLIGVLGGFFGVGGSSIAVYVAISSFMIWESRKTLRETNARRTPTTITQKKRDHSAFRHVTSAIQRLKIAPMIKLPASGVTISLWVILVVSYIGGLFSG